MVADCTAGRFQHRASQRASSPLDKGTWHHYGIAARAVKLLR